MRVVGELELDVSRPTVGIGDYGHVRYLTRPPLATVDETFPAGTKSSYNMALDFLDEIAAEVYTEPILAQTDPLAA